MRYGSSNGWGCGCLVMAAFSFFVVWAGVQLSKPKTGGDLNGYMATSVWGPPTSPRSYTVWCLYTYPNGGGGDSPANPQVGHLIVPKGNLLKFSYRPATREERNLHEGEPLWLILPPEWRPRK